MSHISKILEENQSSCAYYTHVSIIQPKGKFLINNNSIESFYNAYCSNTKYQTGLAEKPGNDIPIIVDIDLKVPLKEANTKKKLYTDDNIIDLVNIYQKTIEEILSDCNDEKLMCVVLEKDSYITKDKKYYKNGIHLHFPNVFLTKSEHEIFLIPRIKQKIEKIELFNEFDIDNVVDKGYLNAPWLMYGSVKEQDADSYEISNIYDKDMNIISIKEAFKNYKIYNNKKQEINKETKDIDYWLPRILSIDRNNREISTLKENLEIIKINKKKKPVNIKFSNIKNEGNEGHGNNLKLASKLLPILNQHRVENHTEWYYIGLVLYNISNGSQQGLDLWLSFSKRIKEHHNNRGSPGNFNDNICYTEWGKMVKGKISIATLQYLARTDNSDEYNNLIKDQMKIFISGSLNVGGSHTSIAKALFTKYNSEFVCSSISKKTWHRYESPIWERNDCGVDLSKKISNEIKLLYNEQIKDLKKRQREIDAEEIDNDANTSEQLEMHKEKSMEVARIDKKIEKIYKLMGCCETAPYKNNVMKECMEVFYNSKFIDLLDSDRYMIAFKNGVYDLKTNTYREGLPTDYLSISLGVEYKEFTYNDQSVKYIEEFLLKVFP